MEWISVKDKFPEIEGSYLCIDYTDRTVFCAVDDISAEYFDGESFVHWINGCEYESDYVTHWMPLPKIPED